MKVLLVNSTFGKRASGSGNHVYTLWKYLKHKIDFVVWHTGNIGYINLPKMKNFTFYFRAKLKEFPDVDIIHIHNPMLAGLFRKRKVNILTIHGDYRTEYRMKYGLLAKLITSYLDKHVMRADVVTCVSPYWAKLYGWQWIPNMVELDEISKIEPSEERYILFVGRDDPIKDYPLFRKIAEEAFRKYSIKSLALGPKRTDTEFLKHAKVSWEKVISYMKSAYALIITSKQEGIPSVLLEAWASGCPIIARNIPPIKVLADLYPASILLFQNINEALSKIEMILYGEAKHELVRNGLKAVKDFDAQKVANQYLELYKTLI